MCSSAINNTIAFFKSSMSSPRNSLFAHSTSIRKIFFGISGNKASSVALCTKIDRESDLSDATSGRELDSPRIDFHTS